jgi:hypothetical protein
MTEQMKENSAMIKEAEAKKLSSLLAFGIIIRKKVFSLSTLNKTLFCAIVVGGVFYLTSINDLTVKGFCLQELKQEAFKKQAEKKDLENELMYYQSLGYLSEKAKKMSLVAVGTEIAYIESVNSSMAKK